jgi:hypothetical protein
MHFVCLCPTYGRPSLVANAVRLFLDQRLPNEDSAHLVIFDDANQIAEQAHGDPARDRWSWRVISQPDWIPLPRKYNALLHRLHGSLPSISRQWCYVVWDDDDVYLHWHLRGISAAFRSRPDAGWAHPSTVWSTYDERRPPLIPIVEAPRKESAQGRFHGGLAIRGSLLHELGGWPQTDLATYDQQMLARLSVYSCVDPTSYKLIGAVTPSYVYRWQDTARWHASGSIDAAGQYARPPLQEPGRVDTLVPRYDEGTLHVLRWLNL